MPSRVLVVALVMLVARAFASDAPTDGASASLHHLQTLDQRVISIGYRLAVGAAALCAEPVPLTGIAVHDPSIYDGAGRDEAVRAFGFHDAPQLLAVAADSPAARAGLAPGDDLLAIGTAAIPPAEPTVHGYDQVERLDALLEADARDGVLDLTVRHDGTTRGLHVPLDRGCPMHFVVRVDARSQADADGRYVEITSGYVERAASDGALAIVLGHELAHNILGHRARLEQQGVHYGLAEHFGRNARLIRETEIEADRLSVDLVARAGFALIDALAFREREWRGVAQALLHSPNHPSPHERLAVLRAEAARLGRDAVRDPAATS